MLTDAGILAAFALLQGAGLALPYRDDADFLRAYNAWRLVLQGVSDQELVDLIGAWLRSPEARFGKWPMPGSLLYVVMVDDADEAWGLALRRIQTHGGVQYGPTPTPEDTDPDDPARGAVICDSVRACGGWRALGNTHYDQLMAQRSAFRAAYRGYKRRGALPPALVDGRTFRLLEDKT